MPGADSLLLAIDQGTSSTKAMLVDRRGGVVALSNIPVRQSHPHPGWVEQDADEIWSSVVAAVRGCVKDEQAEHVAGVALSVQRESVVLWEGNGGDANAIAPIISWQDQRTAGDADRLEREGHGPMVFAKSGLPLDPMFSALKAAWLLDHHDPTRARTASGEWRLGTLDAWLLARCGGDAVTEIGNASRTQLLDIDTGRWDQDLLELFAIPLQALPRVVPSVGPFPAVHGLRPLPDGVPVLSVLADSHAALFGQAGWRSGVVKATYGTGSSVMTLGAKAAPESGMCSTIAWQVDQIEHALEANIRSTGRTMTWLAELLDVDVETLWQSAASAASDGVVVVPAFGGLGAPWWDRDATPLIQGLSLGTRAPQLARAVLESIAFQVDDVLSIVERLTGAVMVLACDGGLTRSSALMQFQADVSGLPVTVSSTANLSALGSAHLAGMRLGWWSREDLERRLEAGRTDPASRRPGWDESERETRRRAWATAVHRSRRPEPTAGNRPGGPS